MSVQDLGVALDDSLAQRMQALGRANEVRCARARLKAEVRAGRRSLAWAVRQDCVQSMKLFDLLICVPGKGRVKISKTLARVPVSPSRTVGSLTPRQLGELLAFTREKASA